MQFKKIIFLTLAFISFKSIAQSVQKAATDAFLITRMAEKFHVQPRALDDAFSADLYNAILKSIDGEKIYFTQDDLKQLEAFKFQLDNEIVGKKTNFLQLLITLYTQRLQQLDTMADHILKVPFNFNLNEKYTVQEDTSYPVNTIAQRVKLYKNFKFPTASAIAMMIKNTKDVIKQKKISDSIQTVFRKKILDGFKRNIQKEMQSPGGIAQLLANDYCKAIATCYDPHSAYMTLTDRENFESGLGKKNMIFGFNLDEDEEGNVTIKNLAPGSSAFKSGMINKGDKMISIQWEGSQPIDVSGASAEEISEMLAANNHAKATITFIKADGTKRQVELAKEQQEDTGDDNKVKSYLLKGAKTIGYISLPSFYEDWEDKRSINGCSNDVAKEILKLKKENIDGLILDVRYNGGGSVMEAVDLAGIFIDAGPITQFKLKDPKPITLKDGNRGTIYDGPLTLMVNGFSASASELLAGTLQDYHRALIVGSSTYGKATGQRILPLDTTINMNDNIDDIHTPSFLKLTISQLYRVTGSTAQFKGVVPDIILPDATDAYDTKEKNEPFAILPNMIDANKYYLPNNPLPINLLQEKGKLYEKEEPYFSAIATYIDKKKTSRQKVDISLNLEELLKSLPKSNSDEDDEDETEFSTPKKENEFYTIALNHYENERVKSDSNLKNSEDTFKEYLSKDPYLKITYRLMLLMMK
jgi:carboxyl-terminal processing protease